MMNPSSVSLQPMPTGIKIYVKGWVDDLQHQSLKLVGSLSFNIEGSNLESGCFQDMVSTSFIY